MLASVASPLTTLTQKNVKCYWSEACEKSFQMLKDRLSVLEGTNWRVQRVLWSIVIHPELGFGVFLCNMAKL